jgi:hypothetical protein
MANLGPGAFKLRIAETDAQVEGRFDPGQEALVLDALRNHKNVLLHVKGVAEFATHDRQIRKLTQIEYVELCPSDAVLFDELAPPIWEQLADIGKQAPAGTWESVPDDLSMRIDEIVYGHSETDR